MPDGLAFVYIISNKSHRLYVGQTTDLARRIQQHRDKTFQNGFTARYHFDRLVYFETTDSVALAVDRERQLKGWKRSRKVELIQRENPNWLDLTARLDALWYLR